MAIENMNFSQHQPYTVLTAYAGQAVTFRNCNMVNVAIDPAWTVESCNTAQISRCAHLHPDWDLPAEPDNCPHVTDIDEITIDGMVVETIYQREDQRQ